MKPAAENIPPASAQPGSSDVYPLDEFYAARGDELPEIIAVLPDAMPEPYRTLLAHNTDMTSTLEKFYDETVQIEVLARYLRENEYYREVVLVLERSKRRVEFGAIKVNLSLFPAAAREKVLSEQLPFGRVLDICHIPFSSRPAAFLSLLPDTFISTALQLRTRELLYGRRNTLFDSRMRPLAEIIEILPR
jgi:hypothetical protein